MPAAVVIWRSQAVMARFQAFNRVWDSTKNNFVADVNKPYEFWKQGCIENATLAVLVRRLRWVGLWLSSFVRCGEH